MWLRGAIIGIFAVLASCTGLQAQTPNPVTPGYQICNTNDPGNTHCSWQPIDATHGLPTTQGGYTPLSPMQTGLGVVTSTALTVPAGATYAVVCARTQNVNYTTDGTTAPTASTGMQLLAGQCLSLSGATVISNFRAIQQAATATLDVSYFK